MTDSNSADQFASGGKRLEKTEPPSSVERAADGSLLLPDGAGWILERVFEHTVMVEAE
jgi:hypothetical protein